MQDEDGSRLLRKLSAYERYYKKHVLLRMAERDISFDDLDNILASGRVIRSYPDDKPLPSYLLLGFGVDNNPLHLVVSVDDLTRKTYIITVYKPDPKLWKESYDEKK